MKRLPRSERRRLRSKGSATVVGNRRPRVPSKSGMVAAALCIVAVCVAGAAARQTSARSQIFILRDIAPPESHRPRTPQIARPSATSFIGDSAERNRRLQLDTEINAAVRREARRQGLIRRPIVPTEAAGEIFSAY